MSYLLLLLVWWGCSLARRTGHALLYCRIFYLRFPGNWALECGTFWHSASKISLGSLMLCEIRALIPNLMHIGVRNAQK
jgi:hypothetical protein